MAALRLSESWKADEPSEGCPAVQLSEVLKVGQVWDAYEQGEFLGDGAFGKVYVGRERGTGIEYAIKIINSVGLGRMDVVEVEREISMNIHFKHARICQLHEVYESDITGELYVVMEYARGGDLFNFIMSKAPYTEEGPYNPKEAARLLVLLVETLIQLHAQGIAHRDLKLENLLLMDPERDICDFRLCDLGGAKWFPEGADTSTHTCGGTKGYCAPEAYTRGRMASLSYNAFKIDVYSLGVVLYICLCGYPPWDLLRSEPAARKHPPTFESKNRASRPWSRVPQAAKDLISQMLHPDPEERIALEAVLDAPWIEPADLQLWCDVGPLQTRDTELDQTEPGSGEKISPDWISIEPGEVPDGNLDFTVDPGEELFELWQNERYRLDTMEWSAPYMRGPWTTRDGTLIFSREATATAPAKFQFGAEKTQSTETVEVEASGGLRASLGSRVGDREYSCQGLLCDGVDANGAWLERVPEKYTCGEWEYATAWRRHIWYKRKNWRSFVRRRRWLVAVRTVANTPSSPVGVHPSDMPGCEP